MEIVAKTIETRYTRTETVEIIPLGDLHLGNVGCDLDKFSEYVDYIKRKPNAYAILMGDMVESITPEDKRFDPKSIDKKYRIHDLTNLVDKQLHDLMEVLEPIKGKVLCVLQGNHEETVRLKHYVDIGLALARALKAPYMGYDGFLSLSFTGNGPTKSRRNKAIFYLSHGYGGGTGKRSGGKVNKLEDAARIFACNCVILAHDHRMIISPPSIRLSLDRANNLIQEKQYAIMSGSFLKGYVPGSTSYIEKFCGTPHDLGTIICTIYPRQGEMSFRTNL